MPKRSYFTEEGPTRPQPGTWGSPGRSEQIQSTCLGHCGVSGIQASVFYLQENCSIVTLSIEIKGTKKSCSQPFILSSQEAHIVPFSAGEAGPVRRDFPKVADWGRAELGLRPGSQALDCALSTQPTVSF